MLIREGGGGVIKGGEGGAPPEQECTPFVRGLIQEMGGGQDLQRPPTAGRSGSKGARRKMVIAKGQGEGASP